MGTAQFVAKGIRSLLIPIEKQVFEGQSLMVQVIKDPIGTKGARCPRRSVLPGACWCFCRRMTILACRKKFPASQRDELRARMQRLLVHKAAGSFCAPMVKTRPMPGAGGRHWLSAQGLGTNQGRVLRLAAAVVIAPGLEPAAAGAARSGG
jgi:hypothetical protein